MEILIKQSITRQPDTRYTNFHGFYISVTGNSVLKFPDISWLLVTVRASKMQFIVLPKTIDRHNCDRSNFVSTQIDLIITRATDHLSCPSSSAHLFYRVCALNSAEMLVSLHLKHCEIHICRNSTCICMDRQIQK